MSLTHLCIYTYLYIRMYICIYTQSLFCFQENLYEYFAGLLPPRLEFVLDFNYWLIFRAAVVCCLCIALLECYLWIVIFLKNIALYYFILRRLWYIFWKSSYFYGCVALVILILRLATGSGYSNFRSLAPVMTPGFGSWHTWKLDLSEP